MEGSQRERDSCGRDEVAEGRSKHGKDGGQHSTRALMLDAVQISPPSCSLSPTASIAIAIGGDTDLDCCWHNAIRLSPLRGHERGT